MSLREWIGHAQFLLFWFFSEDFSVQRESILLCSCVGGKPIFEWEVCRCPVASVIQRTSLPNSGWCTRKLTVVISNATSFNPVFCQLILYQVDMFISIHVILHLIIAKKKFYFILKQKSLLNRYYFLYTKYVSFFYSMKNLSIYKSGNNTTKILRYSSPVFNNDQLTANIVWYIWHPIPPPHIILRQIPIYQ